MTINLTAPDNQLTDGVIDVWFHAAKVAIHHPATPRNEHSHAFAAYMLAQEVRRLRAELQERRETVVVIPSIWKHYGGGKVASLYEQAMNEADVKWRSVDDE